MGEAPLFWHSFLQFLQFFNVLFPESSACVVLCLLIEMQYMFWYVYQIFRDQSCTLNAMALPYQNCLSRAHCYNQFSNPIAPSLFTQTPAIYPQLFHHQFRPFPATFSLIILSASVSPPPFPPTSFSFANPTICVTVFCSTGGSNFPCLRSDSLCQLIWPPSASRCAWALRFAAWIEVRV